MDSFDAAILRLVQADCLRSSNDLGHEIGLSVSAVNERVRKLNSSGVIRANRAHVEASAVGLGLCAFVFVDLDANGDEAGFIETMIATAPVQEVHHVTGSHSYLLKVRTRGTSELQTLLSTTLKRSPGVIRTETVVVLETHKETSELPIPPPDAGERR